MEGQLFAHEVLAVVLRVRDRRLDCLLWKRARAPFDGQWSLPRGPLGAAERLGASASRHLAAKVDITSIAHMEQLETRSDPDRDPRERVLATAYLALVVTDVSPRIPADTAWHPVDALPATAFDHGSIIGSARERLRAKLSYTNIGFALAPAAFTIAQLRDIYVASLGHPVSATNLQRILTRRGVIQPTAGTAPPTAAGGRPATLYEFVSRSLVVTNAFAAFRPPAANATGRPASGLSAPDRLSSGRAARRLALPAANKILCMPRYPDIEPDETGLLDTGDGNLVYWETCGNPDGVPALIVHGGPGSGCTAGNRRSFDPEKFRIIIFDQRNCGRSLPHASDPAADMSLNTTEHLLRDMEQLREHLAVEKWLLRGGSWGVTLSLAYAERHPERVSGMLMLSVTSTRRLELDWLYRGVGRFFPEAWARFRDFAGLTDSYRLPTDSTPPISGLLRAYSRMMEDPDIGVRSRAATEWTAWEDAVISQEGNGSPGAYGDRPDDAKLAFVRICSHYFAHDGFLEDGVLIREAGKLAGIPGVLIHGRNDLGGGACTPWELARAWPGAELIIIEDSGHTGSPTMTDEMHAAAGRLYEQITKAA